MTVIRRDCHCRSVCICETVIAFQDDGRQVSPFKTDIMRNENWRQCNGFNMAFKWWNGEILQPLLCALTWVCTIQNLSHFSITVPNVMSRQRYFFCPSQWDISSDWEDCPLFLIDHVFVSIHRGQIHHSNLSSCWSAELILCRSSRKKRTDSCLDSCEVSLPRLCSKRAARASPGYRSCLAPWVISVMNALAEQILAVGCVAHRVAVLS